LVDVVSFAPRFFQKQARRRTNQASKCGFNDWERPSQARDDTKDVGHFAIAVEAVEHTHKDFYPLMVASTIVGNYDAAAGGGQHMSSELARNCAEFGYAHKYMSFLTSYSDTGLWGNYVGVCILLSFIFATYYVCHHLHLLRCRVDAFTLELRARHRLFLFFTLLCWIIVPARMRKRSMVLANVEPGNSLF
jgi:hypothetical protein